MARVGVYVGNSTADLTAFEGWLGSSVGQVLAFTGEADWTDYQTSVPWARDLWGAVNRPVMFSVPLLGASDATLAQAAAGVYNTYYQVAAQALADFRPSDPIIYIRTGWEFNGNWMKWAALGKEADFIASYRNFVTTFRASSNRFRFDWCVNLGFNGMNPETAYPGDDYVDVIGLDVYYNTAFDDPDPSAAFDFMVSELYGLQWHIDFATAHGKQAGFSEWGVMTDNAGPFIEKMDSWIDTNGIIYHNYWDSYSDFSGKLSDGAKASTGAAYKVAFSSSSAPAEPITPGGNFPMTVRSPEDLKAQMAVTLTPSPGKVYAQHLHDIVDTMKFLTDNPILTITNASHAATLEQDRYRFVFNSGTPVSLTIPSNAPVGWQCLVLQYGAGAVTIVASGGALRSRENHTKTAGLNAQAYLWVAANAGNAPQVALSGDTAV